MKRLRLPSVPLITVDPYFSLWSKSEILNYEETSHWTGEMQHLLGILTVDGHPMTFLGLEWSKEKMKQVDLSVDALSTRYVMEGRGVRLSVRLMTPLFLDDYKLMTRPVSYMALSYENTDGKEHEVSMTLGMSEQFCLNKKKEREVEMTEVKTAKTVCMKMGAKEQKPLNRAGDNIRIDWGYAYLCSRNEKATFSTRTCSKGNVMDLHLALAEKKEELFLFAYDDVYSINYFGDFLKSVWCQDGTTIEEAIDAAAGEYESLVKRADKFSAQLYEEAKAAGGVRYADLLSAAYRQVIAAHKLVVDKDGELLFVSKECFSNGCAATVDVTYPSMPLFLRYAPDLVRAMMRPIYRYARSEAWQYDFAPHDLGTYPLLTGQVYGLNKETKELEYKYQMPVEESGNIIIGEAACALADGNFESVRPNMDLLNAWGEYLIKYGDDPENQLCTDDFAGHLAHNCNLSIKAIVGIMALSILNRHLGNSDEADRLESLAREKAAKFPARAANGDGTLRLAYDRPDSYSMKYNAVWDKIWGTGLFPSDVMDKECDSYLLRMNRYGMPLDSRADYTKSDWMVWVGTMMNSKEKFETFIEPLWQYYNETTYRVPLTDWYDTVSGRQYMFQNRTTQGGLFMKLFEQYVKKNK